MIFNSKKIKVLQSKLDSVQEQLQKATEYINFIENGNLEFEIVNDNPLADSIIRMKNKMIEIASEEKQRQWINESLTKFDAILRNNSTNFGDVFLSGLVTHLNINQGYLFVVNDDDTSLELLSCYAYNRKRVFKKSIGYGEGLTGQCFYEKETIILTDIPKDYVTITSGLGEALPNNVIIIPLKLNDTVYGVLELASFKPFLPHQIKFLELLAESTASTISNSRSSKKTKCMLEEAQKMSEELRSQEEEMRQNMEELVATQEELHRRALENEQIKQIEKERYTSQIASQQKIMENHIEKTKTREEQLLYRIKELEDAIKLMEDL